MRSAWLLLLQKEGDGGLLGQLTQLPSGVGLLVAHREPHVRHQLRLQALHTSLAPLDDAEEDGAVLGWAVCTGQIVL